MKKRFKNLKPTQPCTYNVRTFEQSYFMSQATSTTKRTRLDARLSEAQRILFEKASSIGGYRNFSHFVISSAQEKAEEIIKKNESILASERDAEMFFEAVMKPAKPNTALQNALKDYNTILNSK